VSAEARAAIAVKHAEELPTVAAECDEKRAATRALQTQIDVFAAFDEQARQQRRHLEQIQNEEERREHTDRVRQLSEQTQQTSISQAPISTPLTPHTSPDGGSGDSIPLAQEARKLDAIEKLNETRKGNQKKETKCETKIATHASTLSSALAKVNDDETSEESIMMPDRKSQPSKCGICKEAFLSRNALFKHLDEKHKFCREWQQQLEVEEQTSPRACDGSDINPCPTARSWQIQRKGRSSSMGSKRSNALASKTTRLPHVNSFAALYESDEDDVIFSQATTRSTALQFPASTTRLLSLRLLHATLPPVRAPFNLQSWGLLSSIPTCLSTSQPSTTYVYRANTLTLLTCMYDSFDNHIMSNSLR